jgi:putative restriction endonuclease
MHLRGRTSTVAEHRCPLPRQDNWLAFASTQAPPRVWLSVTGDALFHAALSQQNVARALAGLAASVPVSLPEGASAVLSVGDVPALHRLLRRAFQLSRTLPDELYHAFQKNTASLPKTTEAERLVVQRVGQDLFRAGLLDYWEGRCAITGLCVRELLRASHIKPWAHCTTDAERLDVWNGLLLAPHLDAAFDAGFLTVTDDGEVLLSALLSPESRAQLGFTQPLRVHGLTAGHRAYLPWHRDKVFRRATKRG